MVFEGVKRKLRSGCSLSFLNPLILNKPTHEMNDYGIINIELSIGTFQRFKNCVCLLREPENVKKRIHC